MRWWCSATGEPWTWDWRAYPGIWLCVAVLVGAAWWWRTRRGPWPGSRRLALGCAALLLWGALDWPLGPLGAGYLLSAHTAQYLLLCFAVAPLALWSLAVPPDARGQIPAAHPLAAFASYSGIVLATHVPGVADGLLTSQGGAMMLDLLWITAGVALWWPVLHPQAERRLAPLGAIGYLLVSTLLPTAPAAMMTFAEFPLYRVYELAPRVTSLSAHGDQVIAGLLMKLGGDPAIWAVATALFLREARREDVSPAGAR